MQQPLNMLCVFQLIPYVSAKERAEPFAILKHPLLFHVIYQFPCIISQKKNKNKRIVQINNVNRTFFLKLAHHLKGVNFTFLLGFR